MDAGREADLETLKEDLKNAKTENERKTIKAQITKIVNESRATRDMREHLIKANRNGEVENVKDFTIFASMNKRYSNE